MDYAFIVQLLREKEATLLSELIHVRNALNNFLHGKEGLIFDPSKTTEAILEVCAASYTDCITYKQKILFILKNERKPLLVDEIVALIRLKEPSLELSKVHHTVSYTLSMLAKYDHIVKHPFNRRVKYSIVKTVFENEMINTQ